LLKPAVIEAKSVLAEASGNGRKIRDC